MTATAQASRVVTGSPVSLGTKTITQALQITVPTCSAGQACPLTDSPAIDDVSDPSLLSPTAYGPGATVDLSVQHVAPTASGTTVKLGGQVLVPVSYTPDSPMSLGHLSVVIPEGTPAGSSAFTLTTCFGTSNAVPVTIGAGHAPQIDSFSPVSAVGGRIDVTGKYFTNAVNGILFNAASHDTAQLNVNSDTSAWFLTLRSGSVAEVFNLGIYSPNGGTGLASQPLTLLACLATCAPSLAANFDDSCAGSTAESNWSALVTCANNSMCSACYNNLDNAIPLTANCTTCLQMSLQCPAQFAACSNN
jgi:hypothetical protein